MGAIRTISSFLLLAAFLMGCARTPPGAEPVTETGTPAPAKPVPASVTLQYRYGDAWRQVTNVTSHVPAGPAEIRLSFSKPVRREEVEQALMEAQAAPIRGVMRWTDDRTLNWQVAQLPPRVDFLLGEAHDQDGLALPGGIPSLRVGDPPTFVKADAAGGSDSPLAVLPPDIVSAALSTDHKYLNLTVWSPGATRWDWQTTGLYLDLDGGEIRVGRVDGFQPRLPANLESWAASPARNLVAGLRLSAQPEAARRGERDLVLSDVLGARQQVQTGFVVRAGIAGNAAGVVWSADGARIAALTDSASGPGRSDVVAMDVADREVGVLIRDVPVSAGIARLAWSTDGRYLLAGPVVIDLSSGQQRVLPGDEASARGIWEPGGARLLYSARDWDAVLVVDAGTGQGKSLGPGLLIDWATPGQAYIIRWSAAGTRYLPPGQ
ncbi:MAG TPA: hypothetical protein VD969_12960 [Symbiobacteriaceae bacterium]|nr:hypothetical protein [Symbiobacteriaceae bacterium]